MNAIPDWLYDDLREFEAQLSQVRMREVDELIARIEESADENACQAVLERCPSILASYGRSGHGEWVIPKPRLGERYVPDFIIAHGHSGGLFWMLVEIESVRHEPCLKDGRFSEPLRIAVDQVDRWRTWIEANLDYVHRPRARGGLGLYDLRPRAPAKIVIGRRKPRPAHFNDLRRKALEEKAVDIMSWDRFIEHPREVAAFWDRPPDVRLAEALAFFHPVTSD